jgi:putative DNA primase/helicase
MSAQNQLLRAALAYASRGFPIFPCNPENKRPFTEHGVKDATTDADAISRWWQHQPNAMIALACGHAAGVFVLDLDVEDDPDGKKLAHLIRRLEYELGLQELRATWKVVTPRGGRHLYYAWPDEGEPIGNRGGLLGKQSHVDVRGERGYVILPPSARPDGKAYAWVSGCAPAGKDQRAAPAPAELLACIRREGKWAGETPAEVPGARVRPPLRLVEGDAAAPKGPPRQGMAGAGGTMSAGDEAVRRYAQAALGRELAEAAGAGRGDRNNRLNLASLRLGEFVAQGALTADEVRRALEGAAGASGLVKEDGIRAVRKTIESGLGDGMRKGKRDLADKLAEVRRKGEAYAARAAAGFGGAPAGLPDDVPPDLSQAHDTAAGPVTRRGERPRLVHSSDGGNGKGGDRPPVEDPGEGDGHLAFFPMTDLGNAERLKERFREELRWCPARGWLWWDDRHWCREGADEKVQLAAHKTARAIQDEAKWLKRNGDKKKSKSLAAWGRTSESKKSLGAMVEEAKPYLAVPASALDADPFRFNVLNGTLLVINDSEGARVELLPHDPHDLITKLAPVVSTRRRRARNTTPFLKRCSPRFTFGAFCTNGEVCPFSPAIPRNNVLRSIGASARTASPRCSMRGAMSPATTGRRSRSRPFWRATARALAARRRPISPCSRVFATCAHPSHRSGRSWARR